MKRYDINKNTALITYEIEENSSKKDPFYLQNLMYDLPFKMSSSKSIGHIESLKIRVIVPEKFHAYIIDDLHFSETKINKVEFALKKSSQLHYTLFVANHDLCSLCEKKEFFDCQTLPESFEKKIEINLEEEDAHAYIKCHYLGDQKSSFHILTTQHHKASHTTSKLITKSVLDDAKFLSDNTIIVDKNLEKIIAEQENKNLVIGKNSHAVSIPKLEIDSQDISCKHGASIKSLDKNELFYLQSRGLEKKDAEKILIESFLNY